MQDVMELSIAKDHWRNTGRVVRRRWNSNVQNATLFRVINWGLENMGKKIIVLRILRLWKLGNLLWEIIMGLKFIVLIVRAENFFMIEKNMRVILKNAVKYKYISAPHVLLSPHGSLVTVSMSMTCILIIFRAFFHSKFEFCLKLPLIFFRAIFRNKFEFLNSLKITALFFEKNLNF